MALLDYLSGLSKEEKKKLQNIPRESNIGNILSPAQGLANPADAFKVFVDSDRYNPNDLALQQFQRYYDERNRNLESDKNTAELRGMINAFADLRRAGKDLEFMGKGAGPTKLPKQSYIKALQDYSETVGKQQELADQFQQFKLNRILQDEELQRAGMAEQAKQDRQDRLLEEERSFKQQFLPQQTDEKIRLWQETQGKVLESRARSEAAKALKDNRTATQKNRADFYTVKDVNTNEKYNISKADYDNILLKVRNSPEIKDLVALYSKIGQPVPKQQYDLLVQKYALNFYTPVKDDKGNKILVPKDFQATPLPGYLQQPNVTDTLTPRFNDTTDNNDPLGLGL